jgi:thiamine biosynthesis protein ThiS
VAFFVLRGEIMQFSINGKIETSNARTIDELVKELGLDSNSLVVEHNDQIIRQEQWPATKLQEGDGLELLNFVGGG